MIQDSYKNLFSEHFLFWSHLSSAEQSEFLRNIEPARYKKGDHIHNGSGHCLGVMFVKSGHVRVYMLSDEGREITLYRLFDGDTCIFSASCVLKEITFDVFIDAEDDTEVLLIKPSYYDDLSQKNIYVKNFTLSLTQKRFSDVMWAMQQILFMSFDKRLATFLLTEIEKSGVDKIKLTHEQIAKYMGSAREVVSRMLKYFESDGLVELSRGGIKVIDKSGLKDIAN